MSNLHSVCWWRIVLDEAHMIKSRSSQTSHAAFALTGIHRWCLSGTPLQNRVGEFYSLIRFLRLDPMAHYMCRSKVSQTDIKYMIAMRRIPTLIYIFLPTGLQLQANTLSDDARKMQIMRTRINSALFSLQSSYFESNSKRRV